MKHDYPAANARLAEVAKSWSEGEVSHDVWRKERRAIIKMVWSKKQDLPAEQSRTLPIKKHSAADSTLTMPNIIVPSQLALSGAVMFDVAENEVSHEDVLFLAILLLSMLFMAVFLLYAV
jgi:hypothetical protein